MKTGISKRKRWIAVFSVLTIIAALAAIQLTFRVGDVSFSSWWQLFLVQLIIWNIWGLLTPLIFRLSGIIAKNKNRTKIILVHIPVSILLVVTFLSLYAMIFTLFGQTGLKSFLPTVISLHISSFHWYLILYWITVGVEYYLRMQDQFKAQELLNLQLESQLTEAQLKALKMQLNPHFLFNSLNVISGLVRKSEQKKAVGMLARLSDFLREVLVDRGKQEISLENEIDFIQKYLEIEQLRFGNKLKVAFDIEGSLSQCLVPSLILQPIIENAIKYGISRKKEANNLEVFAVRRGKKMELRVYNDGPPIHYEARKQSLGVGIANTKKRLEQAYGDEASFDISNKQKGVEVRIELPCKEAPQEI